MFFGRKKELDRISEKINSNKFENILLTGIKRIGKTSLLKKVSDNFEGYKIFFAATESGYDNNFKNLWNMVSKLFDVKFNLNDPNDILGFIFEKSLEHKILFIIDEYPYLKSNLKKLDSILQILIDHNHEKSKMKLIISGSYIKAMNNIISYSNPLYGRFTDRIVLKDLNYLEVSNFYPNYSLEDKVKMYSIFGGNPFYNSFIDNNISVNENIKRNILNNPFCLDSPIKIYGEEINNIEGANMVFNSIATGKHRYKDLVSGAVSLQNLPYVLEPLLEMGLINKQTPINMRDNKRKTLYYIEDNFIDFYYKYIFNNFNNFINMNTDDFFEEMIRNELETYTIPKKFEKLSREAILHMNLNKLNNINYKDIGKYWYDDPKTKTNMEFDVVCKDKEDSYVFFEVKFSKNPIGDNVVNKKIYQLNQLKINNYKLGFISKSGFDLSHKKDYILFDLKDLYLER
ncbi:hypothetical protein D8X55_03525 [Malacoplasma penetrans]|uniref:ATPase n=1 Tax=Malacoplasma penetrans (strain HF-2) TaxID=272633 RepID=Q8EVN4_MALP2|nr:ATP-binding protein [Malacoplasma penetrans]RXY96518.1 hypothetical protein D8X55_03525 [Malacoplasma penetrans]BAC44316.1 conserved hypothetical protein [Malacoplasma penetrans HF-2]